MKKRFSKSPFFPQCPIRKLPSLLLFFADSWLFNSFAKLMEYLVLLRLLRLKAGEKVCDVGCGAGTNDVLLALTGAHIFGIDISKKALCHAKELANRFNLANDYLVSDLGKSLSFKDRSFDKVVSFCVLEHLKEPGQMLQEMHRLLLPGGKLVLSTDSFSVPKVPAGLKQRHSKYCYVQKYYRKEELEQLLNRCGFEIEKSTYFVKSRLSGFLFEMLLLAYLRTESGKSAWPLRIFKAFCPMAFFLSVLSDGLACEAHGGYWLAVQAIKKADNNR